MVCQPCQAAWVWSDKAYTWRMMEEGRSYKEWQREMLICLEFGRDLAKGSLVSHLQTHNGVVKGRSGKEGDKEGGGNDPSTFWMSFPKKSGPKPCPVEGCSGRAETRTAMRVNLWHRHILETVVIMEEVNLPHPWCPLCDIMVLWSSLNGMHRRTA